MTKTAAVMIADGCEEVEALSPVDVLRRLGGQVDMVGLDKLQVTSAHGVTLTCDKVLDDSLLDYDIVIFPGGTTGAKNLRDSDKLMKLMQKRAESRQWNAAMCAAPTAFSRYGLLDGHTYTVFPGLEGQIQAEAKDAVHTDEMVAIDQEAHLLTSRGPATAFAYSYAIAETLGFDTTDVKEAMQYNYLAQKIK
ncbi:4-methyl-5(B-hydroxyethyl)-thiazole monophosphate biosynthesis protein [Ligilactobacillus salitolerans]|uniref:4-methyl-5(B-hydroxyethyl)-thiazole monophosphate biosynthesis protein n=1 Tax=Ligilactobacillus salitolerans TaxID=1808352 RepID=A0A401IQD3_9LACO|nr:DJ-1 family glyoxalase III [Ligilactobacillus salitolerans]GBG93749.1 4-methyl-5(B-hydroxyethyl)-thiazole monophosphate biosynthesis protein [Ligilactobacillus salitolerans]